MDFVIIREPAKDVNMPADPGPLWLDRRDCAAIKPEIRNTTFDPRTADERIRLTPAMRAQLRRRRRAAEMTQREAAAYIGRSITFVAQIEHGPTRTIHPDIYRALLDCYGTPFVEAA